MVERRVCTFCGDEIEPGTGRMYIKKDGVVFHFCSSKCYKNLVILGRVPRRTTWTRYYEREKEARMKGIPGAEATTAKARKVKKAESKPEDKPKDEKPAEKPAKKEEAAKKEAPPKAEKKAEAKKPEPKKPVARKVAQPKKEAEKPKAEEAKE
jgi:large subunit ribosomal protein L24e